MIQKKLISLYPVQADAYANIWACSIVIRLQINKKIAQASACALVLLVPGQVGLVCRINK